MPSATSTLQITIPFDDPYYLTSYKILKEYTQTQIPNIWLHSIEQIFTPTAESQWTPVATFFKYKSTNHSNTISHILKNNKITLLIKEKTTNDWKGIKPHPLHKKPSEIFKEQFQIAKLYNTTQK